MITRPLDLSSRLRTPPRGFDFLFYVNVGLIAFFFVLFGSRFVLSPGVGVDFHLPVVPEALPGAISTDVVIAIKGSDLAFVDGAKVNFSGLRQYLAARAKGRTDLRLLVQADAALSTRDLTEVYDMARAAGFASVQIAAEPPPAP
ncbi:MAG: biopolymer transporter ExbD [Opitutaceae bacterium]|jgi:biopolymer transport protein ExbD